MTSWQNFIEEHREQYVKELSDFLRIPSISSLSEHADNVRQAGEWGGGAAAKGRHGSC